MSEKTISPLDMIRDQISLIPADAVSAPYMPIEVATREALETAAHLKADAGQLRRFKIQPLQLSDDIVIAANAANEAESIWKRAAVIRRENEKIWMSLKPQARRMHSDYLSLLSYIYSEESMEEELAVIKEIKEGATDSDMVLDLKKISSNLERNAAILSEYEVTVEDRTKVEKMYKDLFDLQGATDAERSRSSKEKEIRDRAFTHLQALVSKARKAGRVAFRRDPEARKRYRSAYRHRINRRYYVQNRD